MTGSPPRDTSGADRRSVADRPPPGLSAAGLSAVGLSAPGLSAPARRALASAGYIRLEQLADVTEADLSGLHGMGPRALAVLREALAANDLAFLPEA